MKFVYNGIKTENGLYQAWYFKCQNGDIEIVAKNYKHLPHIPGTVIRNDSDSMTDYFCEDSIKFTPFSPYWKEVKGAYEAQETHRAKMHERRIVKKTRLTMDGWLPSEMP
jgi:hypothetical protein